MVLGTALERLGGIADELVAMDVGGMSDVAVADAFIELRREIDRLDAVATGLLVAVEGRGIAYGQGATSVYAWAQWHTGQRWPEAKASFDAGVACEQLPLTAKAWRQGEISASSARTICRGMRERYEDVYVEVEETLVHYAAERNLRELDGLIGYYHKHCDALDDREPDERNGLFVSPVGERWAVKGDFDGLGGDCVKRAVDAATDPDTDPDDTRSSARRRADALVRIARFFLDHEDLPLEAGEAPHVALTLSFETIMSWLPIPLIPRDATDRGAVISRAQREQLLCDCNIARIILGPDSQPLDVGREQRTAPATCAAPSPTATRAVATRAVTAAPTAAKCTMWSHGGTAGPPHCGTSSSSARSTTTSCTATAGPTPSTARTSPSPMPMATSSAPPRRRVRHE